MKKKLSDITRFFNEYEMEQVMCALLAAAGPVWIAQDKDGKLFAYDQSPRTYEEKEWLGGVTTYISTKPALGPWKKCVWKIN